MDPLHSGGRPELYRTGGFCGASRPASMVLVLAENLNCFLFALAAIGGNTELLLQLPKIAHAAFSRFADLSISNCVADADVHGFQYTIDLRY